MKRFPHLPPTVMAFSAVHDNGVKNIVESEAHVSTRGKAMNLSSTSFSRLKKTNTERVKVHQLTYHVMKNIAIVRCQSWWPCTDRLRLCGCTCTGARISSHSCTPHFPFSTVIRISILCVAIFTNYSNRLDSTCGLITLLKTELHIFLTIVSHLPDVILGDLHHLVDYQLWYTFAAKYRKVTLEPLTVTDKTNIH